MDTFDHIDTTEPGFYHSTPNILGGNDIFHDGILVQHTIPNVLGGSDIYDGSGHLQGHTVPNIIGGEDFFNFGGNTEQILSYQDPLLHANECQFPHLNLSK